MRKENLKSLIMKSIIFSAITGFSLFSCYRGYGLSPEGKDAASSSGISGTITFVGDWPDSTLNVRVIASQKYPLGIKDPDSLYTFIVQEFFAQRIFQSDTIPNNVQQYAYTMNLKPGFYEWILVAWFPDISNYLMGVKELGAYYLASDSIPESVYIVPGKYVENVDMLADFSNIYHDVPFF